MNKNKKELTPQEAYEFCLNIIKGRSQELESIIAESPCYAYSYARDVIKGRWTQAELTIMKDPYWAYEYARYVIKEPWLEAEQYIKNSIIFSTLYQSHFYRKDRKLII